MHNFNQLVMSVSLRSSRKTTQIENLNSLIFHAYHNHITIVYFSTCVHTRKWLKWGVSGLYLSQTGKSGYETVSQTGHTRIPDTLCYCVLFEAPPAPTPMHTSCSLVTLSAIRGIGSTLKVVRPWQWSYSKALSIPKPIGQYIIHNYTRIL